ncbi:uncharacterized protein PGTG_07893 [Puccinia graminis f. sp. tritici CRL 75-36-700-3]|uniref:Uncharacterized protein n=1 Tax=Puccinia graminis f. sp. tritici (strain CRL 75-36-700-3 / race SCCL) TaxID=418459 RepID=E3KBD1_PUCGT|nr:uncharacterized protein PGTG_07893 [Puccinia graminis f. sp. tritici CRL 75-36-700-3]EFP81644.2 hypothetical protein PGTG_07893 [Puccinia graminis f. sp. tritici CRL 75-36-700-3]
MVLPSISCPIDLISLRPPSLLRRVVATHVKSHFRQPLRHSTSSSAGSIMSAQPTNNASRVLCEETQSPQRDRHSKSLMLKIPRSAAIRLDYILYIESAKHRELSMRGELSPVKWEKIVPHPRPPPFQANIVSFTWPRFQTEAIIHVADHSLDLRAFLMKNHEDGTLIWMGVIKDHPDYGVGVTIDGPMVFLNFSNAAYDAFPASVTVKITMDNPSRKAYEEAMRAHFEHHRRLSEAIKNIKAHATPTGPTTYTVVHPFNAQQLMEFESSHLNEWAEAIVQNVAGVCPRMPPSNNNFVWIDGRKRGAHNASASDAPPSKRNTGPDFTTPPNRLAPGMSGAAAVSDNGDLDNIEVIPISSGNTTHTQVTTTVHPTPPQGTTTVHPTPPAAANAPLPPASPELEGHHMETYLHVAHIPKADKLTRARLLSNGIVHWSFFQSSSEAELIGIGFPIGIARLLIEGAEQLARYDHNMNVYAGGMSPSPSPEV